MNTTDLELKLCELRHDVLHNEGIKTGDALGIRDTINEALEFVKNLIIPVVSESTYPKEFVCLAKGNYLDKDGSIKEAQIMKDHLGNEYFVVAKKKL